MNQTANMSATTLLEVSDDQPTEGDDYQYEYDVDESLVNYDWSELVPAVVVYSTILLLGICGNALIICTITRYRRLKTVTNTFLASLASADLLLVLICVPVNVSHRPFHFNGGRQQLNPRGCSLKRITPQKKSEKYSQKSQDFFKSSISLFKSFFIPKILEHPKKSGKIRKM